MTSGIYLIVNCINNKLYIGSSCNIKQRWFEHKNELRKNIHCNDRLQKAWNKYGEENFGFSILEQTSVEQLIECEQFWIDYTKCYDRDIGYNLRIKAENNSGIKWSDEHKIKISIAKKGKLFTEEHKRKLSEAQIGRKYSSKTIEKMSISAKNRKSTKRSLEAKKRMSKAQKKNRACRNYDKWPCKDGWKCKCDKCKQIRKESRIGSWL